MMDRIIFLGEVIDDEVSNIITAQLLFLDSAEPGKDISIYINSPGGSVSAGFGIYDTMQYIQSDVSTICTGMAASMASVLLAAGEKEKRFALPHSRIMIHQPMGGMQGQASDMEIDMKEMNTIKKELYTVLSEHTGKPYKTIVKNADRDYWMSSKEAVDYGLIDDVLTKQRS
jgi:ATP-dependent Clp protease protease subunit